MAVAPSKCWSSGPGPFQTRPKDARKVPLLTSHCSNLLSTANWSALSKLTLREAVRKVVCLLTRLPNHDIDSTKLHECVFCKRLNVVTNIVSLLTIRLAIANIATKYTFRASGRLS